MGKHGQIASLTKAQTNKVASFVSKCETRKPSTFGPHNDTTFVCEVAGCNAKFSDNHRLMTHRVRTHGYRDVYRNLIIDKNCPMCNGGFASKTSAQNHIQKVCGKRGTEAERQQKVNEIKRKRAIASGEISAMQGFFG